MKKCPKCKLINPDTAQLCDCGYNFEAKTLYKALTFEVQHPDLECTDAVPVSPKEGIRRVEEHDWDGECSRMDELREAKDEFCPPSIFLRKPDNSFLTLYRTAADEFHILLTIPVKKKLLGLIPITRWSEWNWEGNSLTVLMYHVEDYANHPNDELLRLL
jgi:hypothetical protein